MLEYVLKALSAQTTIRGCKYSPEKLHLLDFVIKQTEEGKPTYITCLKEQNMKIRLSNLKNLFLWLILKKIIVRSVHIHKPVQQSQGSKILANICALYNPRLVWHNGVDEVKFTWKMVATFVLVWRLLFGRLSIPSQLTNCLSGVSLESLVWSLDRR